MSSPNPESNQPASKDLLATLQEFLAKRIDFELVEPEALVLPSEEVKAKHSKGYGFN